MQIAIDILFLASTLARHPLDLRSGMEPLKSNLWSSETLVRGMASTASQPFALLSMTLNQDDDDLRAEFVEPKLKILVWVNVTSLNLTNQFDFVFLSSVHHVPQH